MEHPPTKVRIKDIALAAGVSPMAVSQALNPNPNSSVQISAKTRDRIRELARQMHYQPNLVARQLHSGSSKVIGYILDSHCDMNAMGCMQAAEEVAQHANYRLLIGVLHDNLQVLEQQLNEMLGRGVDGVICAAHTYLDFNERYMNLFQRFNHKIFIPKPQLSSHVSYVDFNEYQGISMLTERLLRQGRKNIYLLNKPIRDQLHHVRITAFYNTMRSHGIPSPENLVFTALECAELDTPALCENMLEQLLPHRPDGLITYRDNTAIMVINLLKQRNIRVPEDIAVVCNRYTPYCSITTPSITAVDYHFPEQGKMAMETLLQELRVTPKNHDVQNQLQLVPTLIEGNAG